MGRIASDTMPLIRCSLSLTHLVTSQSFVFLQRYSALRPPPPRIVLASLLIPAERVN